jgi:hypothetical protein
MVQQEGPDGLYYRDDFNDFSWACRAGTTDEHGIWMNTNDQAGTIMACLVWILLGTFGTVVTHYNTHVGLPCRVFSPWVLASPHYSTNIFFFDI